MSRSSLALDNLRAFVIVIVLTFHSVLAYLDFLPRSPFPFDTPPYRWLSFPMVDSRSWLGFDLFCAFQDVSLISLMFFLSGLFVWPSLKRKGSRAFLHDRLLRLGLPFVLVAAFLMPVAHYPTYLATAIDPSVAAYWQHWLALPVWPTGPAWFLLPLLVLDIAAARLHKLIPGWGEALARLSSSAKARPAIYFIGLAAASALAYVPPALAFTPMDWWQHGPIQLQLSRPLHYAVYFFAGAGIGAYGIERGLIAPDGMLARRWAAWLATTAVMFLLWLGTTALTMTDGFTTSLSLKIGAGLAFVLSCAASCFLALAFFARFATRHLPALDGLKDNAYCMYLNHYVFVVWLQYALASAPLPAIAKAAIVLAGTLLMSWAASEAIRRVPSAARVVGADRRAATKA